MTATKLDTIAVAPGGSGMVFDVPPADPVPVLRAWLDRAAQEVQDPTALALATADAHGHASNRIVRVLSVTTDGVLFTSHTRSQKARELAATRWASGVLYWRETKQQVIVTGPVHRIPDSESDALWAARPIPTQAMSAASRQSSKLDDEKELRARAQFLAEIGQPLPRSPNWAGYRLVPATVEFWQAGPDGLHRRLRYQKARDSWISRRLQP